MRTGRRLAWTALLACLLTSAAGLFAAESALDPALLPSLSIGFTRSVLTGIDPNDAKAATKVWADMILRKKNAAVESNAAILPDLASLEAALAKKTIDLVFMLPQQFLEIRNRAPVVPVLVSSPQPQGKVHDEFLLLIRKENAEWAIPDLRGRRLMVETDQKGTLPILWIETLLMKESGSRDAKSFFASVKTTNKPSKTVLPVFFRQADTCVVTRNAFNTMVELNPQIGKEIVPIAVSPPLLSAVGCVRQDYYERYYDILRDDLELLHKDPQGRQILALFRKTMLIPYKESHIASVEGLLREHGNLQRKIARRP